MSGIFFGGDTKNTQEQALETTTGIYRNTNDKHYHLTFTIQPGETFLTLAFISVHFINTLPCIDTFVFGAIVDVDRAIGATPPIQTHTSDIVAMVDACFLVLEHAVLRMFAKVNL